MTLEELRKAIREALEAARDIATKAQEANRDLTGDEQAQITGLISKARDLKGQVEKKAEGDALLKALADLGDGIGVADKPEIPGVKASDRGTVGQRFTQAEGFKAFLAQYPNGRIPDSAKGITSPPVEFAGIAGLFAKALITGADDTSAGGLIRPDWAGLVDTVLGRPLVMRDLITVGTTGSDTVEYVRETVRTVAAAPVAEAVTAAAVGSGEVGSEVTAAQAGVKPESTLGWEKDSTTVKTIAHWVPATKRAMADAGQIRTIIDDFLITGLDETLETEIVDGDGTGEHLRGVLHTPGLLAQAYDTDLLVSTRKAKTKVRVVGRSVATAYVFNPEDNERIDLIRDNTAGAGTGAFLFGGPAGVGVQTLWGLPRIESEDVPAGQGVVANWKQAVLLDREQASVQVSDSHADFFIRNLLAFLAELRAAFYVRRPAAFCTIDLTA